MIDIGGEFMELLFSFKGKIGRLKFLGFGVLYAFLYLFILGSTSDLVGGLATVAYLYISTTLSVKRLRDIGYSPWLILLYIVPIAGIVLYFMLLFIRGEKGTGSISKSQASIPITRPVANANKKPVASLSEIQSNVYQILDESINI